MVQLTTLSIEMRCLQEARRATSNPAAQEQLLDRIVNLQTQISKLLAEADVEWKQFQIAYHQAKEKLDLLG